MLTSDSRNDRPPAWNAGGWFGAQLGGTLWLAISAAVLAPRSAAVAGEVFAFFLAANLVGIVLWRRRSRMSIFPAMQILLAAIWSCGIAAIFFIDRAGLWETLTVGGGNNIPAPRAYAMLTVLVVALGLIFRVLARKHSAGSRH